MKTLKFCLLLGLTLALCAGAGTVDVSDSRRAKAAKCWGRIKIVDACADFNVKKVDHFADLNVRVTNVPTSVGEWYFVDACADYTVKFVDACEDFSITFSPFPGLN